MSNIYERHVPRGVLLEQGFSEQDAAYLCNNKSTILWSELALRDGIAAVRALTDAEFNRIAVHLIAQGVPTDQAQDRARFIGSVWAIASDSVPAQGSKWYSQSLHSAAACGILLRVVQEAFGKSEEEVAAQESINFKKLIGVQ